MNCERIRSATLEIERLRGALDWLENHGGGTESPWHVEFTAKDRGIIGSSRAEQVMEEMIRRRLPDVVPEAIEMCRSAIEGFRQTIADEISERPY